MGGGDFWTRDRAAAVAFLDRGIRQIPPTNRIGMKAYGLRAGYNLYR